MITTEFTPITVSRANPNDLIGIEEIEALSFSDPWDRKAISSYICSEDGMCFVAKRGTVTLAYLIGRLIAPEGEIYRIATREDRRRRGIAYRLLSYAHKTERGRGLESLFLEVREKNIPARSLYESYGFRSVGKRKNYYRDPVDDAVIMLLTREEDLV